MIIIFYRSKDTGKIVDVHTARDGQTMADITPLVEKYNADAHLDRLAAALEVADDSLEAYLYGARTRRLNRDQDAIQEAIEAIQDALQTVQSLED